MDKYKLRMKFERSHFTDADDNITGEITQDYAVYLENELLKAINDTHCCKSDSELLLGFLDKLERIDALKHAEDWQKKTYVASYLKDK